MVLQPRFGTNRNSTSYLTDRGTFFADVLDEDEIVYEIISLPSRRQPYEMCYFQSYVFSKCFRKYIMTPDNVHYCIESHQRHPS